MRTSKICDRKDRSQAINILADVLIFGDSFDRGSRQVGRQEYLDGRVLVGTFNTLVNRALGGEGS